MTRRAFALGLLLFAAAASAWQHVFTDSESDACREPCFATDVSAYQTVRGPVWMSTSPRDHPERSLLSAVNGSAWEQWYFDFVSADARQSLGLCLSRDPSYASMGQGVLRVEFFVMLANGTVVGATDFVDTSRVIDCCGEVEARWESKDGSRSYAFTASADLRRLKGHFRRPEVRGRFSLDATAPPRYADGSPWPGHGHEAHVSGGNAAAAARTQVSPLLHIAEPVSAARADVSFTLASGESVAWSGLGGHNRFWSSRDWFAVVRGWIVGRAQVGPYAMSIWQDVSRVDGKTYQGSVLFKDGEVLVRAAGSPPEEKEGKEDREHEDYLDISPRFGGSVHSSWGDVSTGWTVDFVSPARGRRWRFLFEHRARPFEVDLNGAKGLAGFTEVVSGGEVGDAAGQHEGGTGVSELVDLPAAMSLRLMLSIWWQLVSGSGANPVVAVWKMVSAPFRWA